MGTNPLCATNAKTSRHNHIIEAFIENYSSTLSWISNETSFCTRWLYHLKLVKLFFLDLLLVNQLMTSLNQPSCFETQQFSSKPLEKNIQTCFVFCRWIWMETIICQVTSTQLKNGQGKSTSHWTRATAMHPGPSQPPVSQKTQQTQFTQWRVLSTLCNTAPLSFLLFLLLSDSP